MSRTNKLTTCLIRIFIATGISGAIALVVVATYLRVRLAAGQ